MLLNQQILQAFNFNMGHEGSLLFFPVKYFADDFPAVFGFQQTHNVVKIKSRVFNGQLGRSGVAEYLYAFNFCFPVLPVAGVLHPGHKIF